MSSEVIPFKGARLANPETAFFKGLDRIIQDATTEDRKARFDSVEQFQIALSEVVGPDKVTSTPKGRSWSPTPSRVIWAVVALAGIFLVLVLIWLQWFSEAPSKPMVQLQESRTTRQGPVRPTPSPGSLLLTLQTQDGATFHLISGGRITLPENFDPGSGRTVEVNPFYMDET